MKRNHNKSKAPLKIFIQIYFELNFDFLYYIQNTSLVFVAVKTFQGFINTPLVLEHIATNMRLQKYWSKNLQNLTAGLKMLTNVKKAKQITKYFWIQCF